MWYGDLDNYEKCAGKQLRMVVMTAAPGRYELGKYRFYDEDSPANKINTTSVVAEVAYWNYYFNERGYHSISQTMLALERMIHASIPEPLRPYGQPVHNANEGPILFMHYLTANTTEPGWSALKKSQLRGDKLLADGNAQTDKVFTMSVDGLKQLSKSVQELSEASYDWLQPEITYYVGTYADFKERLLGPLQAISGVQMVRAPQPVLDSNKKPKAEAWLVTEPVTQRLLIFKQNTITNEYFAGRVADALKELSAYDNFPEQVLIK